MSVQVQIGALPTQREPEVIREEGKAAIQIQNSSGGYSFKIDDLMRFRRYLIMGSEGGSYHTMKKTVDRESVRCLDSLFKKNRGVEAVELIKNVSVNRSNIKQDCLLYALAVCARSNDPKIKSAAYDCLKDVCRIPTHLFMFIKFCEQESVEGTGWGRAHRRAISDWYHGFKDKPEDLARLIVKYKHREGWRHRDVLRLAHVRCKTDMALAFILRYIAKTYQEANNMYLMEENDDVRKVANILKGFEDAVHCTNNVQLCAMIREQNLTWEMALVLSDWCDENLAPDQVGTDMLREKVVWLALLPKMPLEAMVRNLGRMTCLGLFAANSEDEEIVLKKLYAINNRDNIMEVGQLNGPESIVHPFKLLLAWNTYKQGVSEKGKLKWEPNTLIVKALTSAFYRAFHYVEPTNKKLFLAVDVSGSMSMPALGSNSITCATAAASMLMQTVRTEQDFVVKAFCTELVDFPVSVSENTSLDNIILMTEQMTSGGTNCAQPMFCAQEEKMRDIDAFVVFTDCETWSGNVHPAEALRQYRSYASRPNVKLIVVGMSSSDFTIADREDPYMLDICGFDSAAPKLMSDFIMERI